MGLQTDRISRTFRRHVRVRFNNDDGSIYEGDFTAHFKRVDQPRIQLMIDENWTPREVCEEVIERVEGIGKSPTEELPAEDQTAYVLNSYECASAAMQDFFEAMAQKKPDRTSKRQR